MKKSDNFDKAVEEAIECHGKKILEKDRQNIYESLANADTSLVYSIEGLERALGKLENYPQGVREKASSALERELIDRAVLQVKSERSALGKPLEGILYMLKNAAVQLEEYWRRIDASLDKEPPLLNALDLEEKKSQPIETLGLTVSILRKLTKANITTIAELMQFSAVEQSNGKLLNQIDLAVVRTKLRELGISSKSE